MEVLIDTLSARGVLERVGGKGPIDGSKSGSLASPERPTTASVSMAELELLLEHDYMQGRF